MKTINHTIHCKTLTPVHIGNGDMLASIGDYYVSSNHLFLIDKEKLDQYIDPIGDKDFFDDYIKEIKENVSMSESDFSIVTFLSKKGIKLEDITADEIPIISDDFESHRNSQLKLAIKQNRKLYFPGSSLKGALKAVMFYFYMKQNPAILHQLKELIEKSNSKKYFHEQWAKKIENIFSSFFKEQKSDFNFIRVADTTSFDDSQRGIWNASRIHLYNQEAVMLHWLFEGIKIDTPFTIHLSIHNEIQSKFLDYMNKIELTLLFSLINDYAKIQLEREIKEINQSNVPQEIKNKITAKLRNLLEYTNDEQSTILRIGAGKTFFYNTICNLLDDESFAKLRYLIKIGKLDEIQFPLSRTFTSDFDSMGWVLLEKPKEPELEIPLNEVSEIIKSETLLEAVVIGNKKIKININGTISEAQLFLDKFQQNLIFNKGDIIEVYVKQMRNDGGITMVGIKD